MDLAAAIPLETRIQQVLDEYRPTLYQDGGDVEVICVDEKGVAYCHKCLEDKRLGPVKSASKKDKAAPFRSRPETNQ